MVGQQMIMEARQRTRYSQQPVPSHPRARARQRQSSASVMYSIFKPLMAIGNALRSRFRLPE